MSSNSLGVNVAVTGRLPKRVVIVGQNESAWMAATMLSMHVRQLGCRLTVISNGPPEAEFVGESSTPALRGLLSSLRVDEHDLLRTTQGTYRVATQFSDWVQNERDFWVPVAPLNERHDAAGIFPHWFSERSQGRLLRPFHSYSLHWGASLAGKGPYGFSGPSQISKTGAYAFHFDGQSFAAWLRKIALANGCEEIVGEIATINTNGRGGIAQLKLETGAIVASDFFFDCTGTEARLMRGTLKDEFVSRMADCQCDRLLTLQLPGRRQIPPFTRITGLEAGYAWQFSLAKSIQAGYAFSSKLCHDASAMEQFRNLLALDGVSLHEAHTDSDESAAEPVAEFSTRQLGRQTTFWRDNVVAVGTAAGSLYSLISAGRHLAQLSIEAFLELFPERQSSRTAPEYFNARMTRAFDELQDYAQLHFLLSKRTDTEFWREIKTSTSSALTQKLALFTASGSVGPLAPEAFGQSSYWSLLAGCGRFPASPSLASLAADPTSVQQHLRDILKFNEAALKDLPLHEELLDWVHIDHGLQKSA